MGEPVDGTLLEQALDTVELPIPACIPVTVELRDERLNLAANLAWDSAILRRLYLWRYPTRSGGVFSIEVTTVRLRGEPGSDERLIEPGESFDVTLEFTVHDLDQAKTSCRQ